MTPDQKVHWMVVHRKKDGIEAALDAAGVREQPVRVLNEVLLPAMKEVGDKFGAGELILPFVLQSAEVMKKAVKHLEQFLERAEGYTKGKVVLATVYGDVHDIGKSLVNTILSNNGYTVFDLGKQVPVNTIIDKAIEVNADAIGLSALLVSTSKQMPLCVQELDRRGLKIPGADRRRGDQSPLRTARAVRRRRARVRARACSTARTRSRDSRRWTVCRTTTRARRSSAKLHGRRAQRQVPPHERRQGHVVGDRRRRSAATSPRTTRCRPRRSSARARSTDIPLDEVFSLLDLDELYRLQWGGRGSGPEYEATVKQRVRADARAPQGSGEARRLAPAEAVYGYFPVQAAGNDLVIYDPERVRGRRNDARDRALPLPAAGRA